MFEKHYLLTGKLFVVNLLVLAAAFFLGKYLDSAFGYEYFFKLLLILLAFPLIQTIIYLNFKK